MTISVLQAAILIFMIYICVYSIISRICKCFENCALAKMGIAVANTQKKNTTEAAETTDENNSKDG